jgi:hypothetical protein
MPATAPWAITDTIKEPAPRDVTDGSANRLIVADDLVMFGDELLTDD